MDQNTQIVVPSSLLDNVVQYVEVSSMATKRALDEVGVHRQSQQKAASLREPLLKHMISAGVVAEHQKEAAEAMLGSHAETLQLLKAAVDKIAELKGSVKQASEPGQAVDGTEGRSGVAMGGSYKTVGEYNSLTHPVVGEKTAFVKESDKPLLALIGR